MTVRALQPETEYTFAMLARNNFPDMPQGAATIVSTRILGDVDGDGFVTAADVAIVEAALNTQYPDAGFNPAADVNGDDRVSFADFVIVRSALPCANAGSGDFNGNGAVDSGDILPFVEALLNATPATICIGDVNGDGAINGLDIQVFLASLF